jgi:hypothetical protein
MRNFLRNFSSFIPKSGRETFTPKITKTINKAFDESFPDLTLKSGAMAAVTTNPSSTSASSLYSHNIQPGRSYREELYASRRFELNPSQNSNYAFRRLQNFLQDEKIPAKVREKRHFVRPGLVEHAMIYAGRRKKFNSLVRETIRKVINIHESQK